MTNLQLAIQFFLQLGLILIICRVVGIIASRFGQPQVVAEMIAGVCMGPSLLGALAPAWSEALFPKDSMKVLFPVSQLGLALYMFIVGLEFRMDIVRKRFGSSVGVSFAGMAAPFVLGAILGWAFWNHTTLFPKVTSMQNAMIFMGASMCITAFPMLARIIHFKGLSGTLMGTVAIGAGAIDDAAAWCLLAIVMASFDNNPASAIQSIGGGLAFVAFVTLILRPILAKNQRWFLDEKSELSESGLVLAIMLMALGAWITDYLQLHAVFGAFVIGSSIPRNSNSNVAINRAIIDRMQPLTVALLLPLFFTYSGLNTQITLLNSWTYVGVCLAILLAAIVGKGVACSLGAKLAGLSTRDALGIGVLMNARGLMELIIINKGLERGIIGKELFACLVIMAIVTTLMASPLFDRLIANRDNAKSIG
jgi:Kef-type K+ transport system membrane component KefB